MITEKLKGRFYQNMTRYPDLEWDLVEARLTENKEVLEVLKRMEENSGALMADAIMKELPEHLITEVL